MRWDACRQKLRPNDMIKLRFIKIYLHYKGVCAFDRYDRWNTCHSISIHFGGNLHLWVRTPKKELEGAFNHDQHTNRTPIWRGVHNVKLMTSAHTFTRSCAEQVNEWTYGFFHIMNVWAEVINFTLWTYERRSLISHLNHTFTRSLRTRSQSLHARG